MTLFPKLLTQILLSSQTHTEEVCLGEPVLWETDTFKLGLIVERNGRQDIWENYSVAAEIQNKSSGLMEFDKSKVYLIDDSGRALFTLKDDSERALQAVEQLGDDADEVLARLNYLLGRPDVAELTRIRRTLQEQQANQQSEKLVEIPPWARSSFKRAFRTPLKSAHLTLGIVGILIDGKKVKVEPIRIRCSN